MTLPGPKVIVSVALPQVSKKEHMLRLAEQEGLPVIDFGTEIKRTHATEPSISNKSRDAVTWRRVEAQIKHYLQAGKGFVLIACNHRRGYRSNLVRTCLHLGAVEVVAVVFEVSLEEFLNAPGDPVEKADLWQKFAATPPDEQEGFTSVIRESSVVG